MLNFEAKKLEKAIKFLSLLGCELSSLEYIEKDGVFYNSKTFEPIDNLLTYILINYQHPSDLHFNFDSRNKTIGLRIRRHGQLIKTSLISTSKDNYTNAQFGNSSINYSTEYFKDIFSKIVVKSSIESGESYDFLSDVTLPVFGNYRLRKVACGHDGLVRILSQDQNYGISHDNNIMQIKENPIYIGEAEFNKNLLICSSFITLTPEIQQQVELYNDNILKMFNAIPHLIESFNNGYLDKKMKLVLEYIGDNVINVSISKNYSTGNEMDKVISKYFYENYQDFYDPVFTNFVENVTKVKIDPTIGEFKTPEAFQNYLLSLAMFKI